MRGVGSDHESKRSELVTAALRAVEHSGVDGLTFRRVASEAGVSLGRVQHYFGNRTELVRAAYARVQELESSRVTAELSTIKEGATARAIVAAVLQTLIPLTPSRLAHLRITQLFDIAALGDPAMLQQLRNGHAELLDFMATQLDRARREGDTTPGLDPSRAALLLLSTAEGLSNLVLMGHTPAPFAQDLLSQQLDLILRDQ